ncbi:MAG: acetyl-CoA C-acyltransferase [Halobacteriovoraceae bacterium]|nr:acetyl-CoA C-acyltransferase [Halobacteriovoraceae bacterium]MBC96471.1 acetyl-CoA C-acyltransferase [Halobacteriovoraceae bacterium]|tara:strand:+ start:46496 stop:47794 length:1299 start_codon:yes stop_codon:yes gene_type:complete
MANGRPVYIVSAKRTPQAKSGTDLKDVAAPYLGSYLIRQMADNANLPPMDIDEVIIGNVGNPAKYPNIGRVIALEAGLHKKTSGYTVHRNCASGLEAVSQGFLKVASGRSELIFAGGVENMSQMPLIYSEEMTELFMNVMKAKTVSDKLKVISHFRPPYLSPIIAIEQGLTDPFCGLNMGQTAEVLAREFGISREEQDAFAQSSHMRAIAAQKEGRFNDEILPIIIGDHLNKLLSQDVGPRESSSVEKLAKLKPYFDRKSGTVTVGNACPITDGGSMLLLASEEAVKKYDLDPMAKIVDYHFHGLEPERMGMGPLLAMDGVFKRTGMTLDQMDLVEINEAFAAQVLAVKKSMTEKKYADKFGVETLWGEIPDEKLNVNGGAIALGHPVGSTGSRLVVTLAHEMVKRKSTYGVASLCIGGGQGGAIIIENLKK